jgi:DNA ligase-1
VLLSALVGASESISATRSRTAKVTLLADVLSTAGPEEVATATAYLSGVLPQRRVGVGWRGLSALPAPAAEPLLTLTEVDRQLEALSAIAGSGSAAMRSAAVEALFSRATAAEQDFLRRLLTGDLRQGALDGVMLKAIALAADVPEAAVRRAVMLSGYAAPAARAALTGGVAALAEIGLVVGRPVRPMLAASAPDVPAAVGQLGSGPLVVDGKLDGIRIQAHKRGDEVRLFTRSLDEVTERLPDVVEAVLAVRTEQAVLDGEAIALDAAGRPRPFQETGARTMSRVDVGRLRSEVPLSTFLFDVLHLDGEDLIDCAAQDRFDRLHAIAPAELVVPRRSTSSVEQAQDFFDELVRAGHEGVVVKDPSAPYAAGRRGSGWVKVKPRHTLDLVVLAVEWGSGRRRGLLSNIHLGARDPRTGGFVMLGKTFKGMTDEMLAWQTERFLGLQTHREGHTVHVRPEQVVEVAFDGLQRSSRYPGGVALRFARVLRYREDKNAEQCDTIETVLRLGGAP